MTTQYYQVYEKVFYSYPLLLIFHFQNHNSSQTTEVSPQTTEGFPQTIEVILHKRHFSAKQGLHSDNNIIRL